jgi:hypothetical protein
VKEAWLDLDVVYLRPLLSVCLLEVVDGRACYPSNFKTPRKCSPAIGLQVASV